MARPGRRSLAYPIAVESPSAVSDGTQYIYIMNGVSSGPVYQTAMYRYDTVANTYMAHGFEYGCDLEPIGSLFEWEDL